MINKSLRLKFLACVIGILFFFSCATLPPGKISAEYELKKLDNLSFRDFLDKSYISMLKCYPELVTEMGLDEELGMPGNTLDTYKEEDLKEIELLERGIHQLLHKYEPAELNQHERISYLVYSSYLEDLIKGQEYRHFNYLVSYMITSVNYSTEHFFAETHPLRNLQDAENYIHRLRLVDSKMADVAAQMALQQDKGIVLPYPLLNAGIKNVNNICYTPVKKLSFYKAFAEKLNKLDISEAEKTRLLQEAEAACSESVIPGYRRLAEKLVDQQSIAGKNPGVNSFPGGEDYYSYALAHHTNSNYTAAELNTLGLRELEIIHQKMRRTFEALGFDPGQSIERLYRKLDRQAEIIPSDKMVEIHEELVAQAKSWMEGLFSDFPENTVQVKGDKNGGGFYVPPSMTGDRPGIFYATEQANSYYTLPTLTFHETYPGHHYQIALNAEMNLPLFQRQANFTGFLEGWALYSERLMAETGYYQNDSAAYLGYLQAAAFRAARLVVDTGLHMQNWSIEEAVDFFNKNTGYPRDFSRQQIYRYLVWPGQAASYYAGFLEFLNLENGERQRLGKQFNYKDFHQKLLENGPMPLTILKDAGF